MPNTVIYANLLPAIGIVSLMAFMRMNPLFDKKQNNLFFLSSLTILFMLIVISVNYTVALTTFDKAWIIRRIASFLHFSFLCTVPIFLIRILVNKKMNLLLYVPALINWIICASSMFVNLVFFFPENGGYERGPLFAFLFLVTLFYIISLLILSLKKRKERSFEVLF